VERKDETNSTDEIEVTPEMIEAASVVLLADASLDIGPTKASIIVEAVLKHALAVYRNKKRAVNS
jgi:hypothetical protein